MSKDNHLINPILLIRESCLDLIRKGLSTRDGVQLKLPRVAILYPFYCNIFIHRFTPCIYRVIRTTTHLPAVRTENFFYCYLLGSSVYELEWWKRKREKRKDVEYEIRQQF